MIEHMFDAPTATTDPDEVRAALHAALDAVLDADPAGASGSEAQAAIEGWHRLRVGVDGRMLAVLPTWEASGIWAVDGTPSTTTWLVHECGLARAHAAGLRRTALLARPMPHVSGALRAGTLPGAHASALVRARRADVAGQFDRDEAELVGLAQTLAYDAFRDELAAWRLRALEALGHNEDDRAPGPLTEADRLQLTRSFGGRGLLSGELGATSFATLLDHVDAEIDGWHRSGAIPTGDPRTRAELRAEALLAIVERGAVGGTRHGAPRPSIIAVTDLDTILGRACTTTEERLTRRATVLGGGPIASVELQRLLCDADLDVVIVDGLRPLALGRTRRHASAHQVHALIAASGGTCEWPGCDAPPSRCEAHHLRAWQDGGSTDIENLALLCRYHHHVLHECGFTPTRGPDGLTVSGPGGREVVVTYPVNPHLALWRRPATRAG